MQSNIANNANGFVVATGDLIGLDTSGITEGTQLYLSSTVAGEYTTTKQVAPAHLVYVGIVTRSHPTQGQIEVKIQNGYELDELHDVLISGQTDGQVLQFEGASGLWKNKTLATGLTVGSTAISSGTNGRVLFQNGGVVQQSSALSFASGTFKLISNGGTQTLLVRNSADTFDIFSTGNSGANVHGFLNINDGANYIQISAGGRWVKMAHDYGQLQFTNSLGNNTFTLGNNGVSSFSGNVNIGGGTNGARLDVRAQGALSTDLALRVRNSANTGDMFHVKGNGNVQIGVNGISMCRADDPAATRLGNIKYESSDFVTINRSLAVLGGLYGNTSFGTSQVALEMSYTYVGLRCYGGAGNTGFIFNTIVATTGNHFMRIQNGSNDFLNVSSGGGFLFTNIASTSFAMPNASAKVQIDSTTQGFLPPRMTNAQRTAIATPAVGLMVYCTDATEGLYIYKSTGWTFVI